MNKGLRAQIYQDPHGNFSNKGISSRVNQVTIVGPNVPQVQEVTENAPAVIIVKRVIMGKEYVHARPLEQPVGSLGPMAGGCLIYSSDGRYTDVTGVPYAIKLHDRFETQAQYDALSI